jgi:hypothetical protein
VTTPGAVTLLGPQRLTPTLPNVVRAAGIDLDSSACAPMATITAGWQEREDDDRDLVDALLGKTVNLRLYARAADIFERDTELAAAHVERGRRLRDLQSLYELRLAHAMDAVYELARRPGEGPMIDDEINSALDAVRVLDQRLLDRSGEVVGEFVEHWRPAERDVVAAHRADVAAILGESCGLAIAGGQVPTLLNRIHLLGVADHVAGLHVFAWSAGAMVATERIVVFHDDPPHGRPYARMFEHGLGWIPGVVAMPDARRRLHLEDRLRVGLLARRFAPAVCLGLDDGAHLVPPIEGDGDANERDARADAPIRRGVLRLSTDGSVAELAA